MPDVQQKIRWGVLGVAAIAVKKVIPAMQRGALTEMRAIASRDLHRAQDAARSLGIPHAYGSYDELLRDPEIDAVYNPLPNHLHVPWSIKAAEAGKHVLCEKPIALSASEAKDLLDAERRTGVTMGEAFMVRTHPQWLRTRELVTSGEIGELRASSGFFSYYNVNPANIRNIAEYGGGGMMDIGCYPIFTTRFVFGEEPKRVVGLLDIDPVLRTDRLASVILDYPSGQAIFTCSTQLVPYQRMHFFGSKGRIEIEIPFNAPPDRPCRIFIDSGADLFGGGIRMEEFPTCDQYTIQGDEFSKAILGQRSVPVSMADAVRNMAVIDAVFRSVETGKWESIVV
ncbi:MAG: Gfo/Idh/MocA family oxidoreductase [Acidobacteriaceae bacterium]|nr:Gfo/Idh/MocA family oxidoreductase [Acidobacteriaceae bacterium]